MTSPSPRFLLPLGLVALFIAGCKSSPRTTEAAPPEPRSGVTSEDIQRAPGQSVEEVLKGRVAGVTVTHSRGHLDLRQ